MESKGVVGFFGAARSEGDCFHVQLYSYKCGLDANKTSPKSNTKCTERTGVREGCFNRCSQEPGAGGDSLFVVKANK